MSAGTALGPCVGVTLARAARNAMNSATTKTSAIDHLAIVSTNASVRRRRRSPAMRTAQATSAALKSGTITLKRRMSVAGTGLPTSVQAPNRSENAARLLVDHDLPKVLFQRCRDLRRELVEHALAQVAARAFDERDDCRVHHRLEHGHRVIGQAPLQNLWSELRDALARQDAANRQHRRKQSRDQETDGHDEHREHDQPGGSGGQRRGLVEQELLPMNNTLVFLTRTSCARACGSSVPHSISQERRRA